MCYIVKPTSRKMKKLISIKKFNCERKNVNIQIIIVII